MSSSRRRKPKQTSEAKAGSRGRKGERKKVRTALKQLSNQSKTTAQSKRIPIYAMSKGGRCPQAGAGSPSQHPKRRAVLEGGKESDRRSVLLSNDSVIKAKQPHSRNAYLSMPCPRAGDVRSQPAKPKPTTEA